MRLFTLVEGKQWKPTKVEGGQAYGTSNGRFVSAESRFLHVYDISKAKPKPLFRVHLPEGSRTEGLVVELRDSRVLLLPGTRRMVVMDVDGERVTNERLVESEKVYYLPPDKEEVDEFRELIGEVMPRTVPVSIAGIIEKFI